MGYSEATFYSDLEHYLAAYEREAMENEYWDATEPDWREKSVDPEDADTVGYWDFTDPDQPFYFIAADGRIMVIPGADGNLKSLP